MNYINMERVSLNEEPKTTYKIHNGSASKPEQRLELEPIDVGWCF